MKLKFTVEVEVSHTSGKFASREEIKEAIIGDYLDGSSPNEIMIGDSEYAVDSWEVQDA